MSFKIKNKVSLSVFGTLKSEDGHGQMTSKDVRKFVLTNKNGMSVEVVFVSLVWYQAVFIFNFSFLCRPLNTEPLLPR